MEHYNYIAYCIYSHLAMGSFLCDILVAACLWCVRLVVRP